MKTIIPPTEGFNHFQCPALSPLQQEVMGAMTHALPWLGDHFLWCQPTSPNPNRQTRLNLRQFAWSQSEPRSWDPATSFDMQSIYTLSQQREGLLRAALGNGAPRAGVATHYDVSDDGRVYVFHLRPNARFSSGEKITATHFIKSFTRILTPATRCPFPDRLSTFVRGADDFYNGKPSELHSHGLVAVDEHTLRIELSTPLPQFPYIVASAQFAPVPNSALSGVALSAFREGSVPANGAYLLDHHGNGYTAFRANPSYWAADQVFFQSLTVYFSADERTHTDWFSVGKTDWSPEPLSPESVIRFENAPSLVESRPECSTFLYLNNKRPPFDDPNIRRVLAYAIDSERIAYHLMQGTRMPASSFVPVTMHQMGYVPAERLPWDMAKAGHLLAEMGYPRGIGLPEMVIEFVKKPGMDALVESIQDQLKFGLRMPVALHNLEAKMLINHINQRSYQAIAMTACADYPDPIGMLNPYKTDSSGNWVQYSNPKFDEVITRAEQTADPVERYRLGKEAEAILWQDMPLIPMLDLKHYTVFAPELQGLVTGGRELHRLVSDYSPR